ncbi:MAG: hypothetical protein Q9165_008041 [Trypethelium subeluteriae]
MDPLSILGSLIAIAQVVDRTHDVVSKTRAAPDEVLALLNELSDLKLVVDNLITTLKDIPASPILPLDQELANTVKRLKHKASEIEETLKENVIRGVKTDRLGHPEVNENGVEMNRLLRGQALMLQEIRNFIQCPGVLDLPDVFDSDRASCAKRPSSSSSTAVEKENKPYKDDVVGITGTRASCANWCRCSCHVPRIYQTTPYLSRLFGSLFIGYTSSPVLYRECDSPLCERSSGSSVSFTYYFPSWFWARAILFSLESKPTMSASLTVLPVIDKNSDLFHLIKLGDIAKLRTLFGQGRARPMVISDDAWTPLHVAVHSRKIEVVRFLLKAGADPNWGNPKSPADWAWENSISPATPVEARTSFEELFPFQRAHTVRINRFSPIHEVCLGLSTKHKSSVAIADFLRTSRSVVNSKDRSGATALHWVATNGNHKLVEALLRCGADPNVEDEQSWTPLHRAVQSGSSLAVRSLVLAGANTSIKNQWGEIPLHALRDCSDPNNVARALMMRHGSPELELRDIRGQTPLIFAAERGSIPALKALLALGADLEATSSNGYTALATAIHYNQIAATRFLLRRGAMANLSTTRGCSLLHIVAVSGSFDMMDFLCDEGLRGIDTHGRDAEGRSALDTLKERFDRDSVDQSGRQMMLEAFTSLTLNVRPVVEEIPSDTTSAEGGTSSAIGTPYSETGGGVDSEQDVFYDANEVWSNDTA